MIEGHGQTIPLRRLVTPGWLFVAGILLAALTATIVAAESLNRPLLHALAWLTPVRALVIVAVLAAAASAPATRARLAPAARAVLAVPRPLTLAILVTSGAAFQIVRGARKHTAFILGDELIYSDLAKSVAIHGELLLRGSTHLSHSVLYPVAMSPFFALADDAVSALAAAKTVQAVLMAAAAVPAYLLARRVVTPGWSLTVAALTAFAPWAGYASLFMTEALFFPCFVTLALVLVLMLERPSTRRQLATVGLLVVLVLIRPQAFALLPAIVTAVAVFALADGRPRALRRYSVVLGAAGALSLAAAAVLLFAPSAPGGAYGALFDEVPGVVEMAKWAVWNLADFALALGIVAVAAFPLALARLLGNGSTPSERAVAATAVSLTAWVGLSATLLSASEYGLGWVHERSVFYLAPLIIVCFVHWLASSLPRPRAATAACAAGIVAVLAAFPERLVTHSNALDAPALVPVIGLLEEHPSVSARVWLVGAAVAGAVILLAARRAIAPLASIALAFVLLAGSLVWSDDFDSDVAHELAWVDRALPPGATATLLHVDLPLDPDDACGEAAEYEQQGLAVSTEFLNTRVDRVLHLYGPVGRDGLESPELTVAERGGILLTEEGTTVGPDYVVVDTRQVISGTRLRRFDPGEEGLPYREGASLTLWHAEQPLRVGPISFPAPPRPNGEPC